MSYIALANITLSSSAATVTFTNIPNTYRDLIIIGSGTSTGTALDIGARFNSDSGTNYSQVAMFGLGSTSGSSSQGSETGFGLGRFSNSIANFQTSLMDYSATDKHKTCLTRYDDATVVTVARAGRWANTNAITSIQLYNASANGQSFAIGSTFALYGIAG
jgi:hypothetical protein